MKMTISFISLIMSLVMMVTMVTGLGVSASASETDETEVVTEFATEVPSEVPTDAPTQIETQAPTVEETQKPTDNDSDIVYNSDKVAKVGKLYKDGKYCTRIDFHWNEVEGAEGYRIYYKNNDKDEDYTLLATTAATSISVRDLSHTTPYQFKVAAYVVEFGKMYEGVPQVGKTATQPLKTSAPQLKQCSSSTKIQWARNARADGYKIYRQDSTTNGKYVLYKTIKDKTANTFVDKNVKGGKAYNYQVRAYREMYKGKTFIGEGATLRTVAGLHAPAISSTTSQLRRVSINWKKNSYANGYEIYYKADDADEFKYLTSTNNNFLNTKKLRAGHTYYFRIKPYKYVGAKKVKVYGTQRSLNKKVTSTAYGKKIGDTYIEISIKQQHMWFYIDGKLYVDTPVVTGNYGGYDTPKGAYNIFQRTSPATLVGPTWCVNVKYWLAFTRSGCGIHDSTWRSSSEYGGTTYMGDGSHGCVNTPYSKVKKIYEKAKIGTHVVVY